MNSEFIQNLIREIRDVSFLRILSSKNSWIYLDILNTLDIECSEKNDGLSREESLQLIIEILNNHPEYTPDQADLPLRSISSIEAQSLSLREKARQVLDYLMKSRWLEEPPRRDWQRRIYFDAHGSTILSALRAIAKPENVIFTDKLLAICAMIQRENSIIEPWQVIESCLSQARQGLNELRAMQKSVLRLTRRQMEETTLKGNLALVFDDYADKISHACYAELIHARLPVRLPESVTHLLDHYLNDTTVMENMITEYMRRDPQSTFYLARRHVFESVEELIRLLNSVLPLADEIDRRTADFTRRSLARFRYLQDITGERRTEMKLFFDCINRNLSGKRYPQLNELPHLPTFKLPEIRIPLGRESLYTPHQRKTTGQMRPLDEEPSDSDKQQGLQDMERALKESLSVRRANDFSQWLKLKEKQSITSQQLNIEEPQFVDLIALLLHSEAPESQYTILPQRLELDQPKLDILANGFCKVEHFEIKYQNKKTKTALTT
jgi:hypothetical protein